MEEGQAAGDRAIAWVDDALPETNTKTSCKSQPEPGLSIYERYTNTSLFKALYPLFFSMKLTGLYFVRNYPEPGCRPRSILPTPSQLFATGCLIIHWLNVIRSLYSFNSEDQFGSPLFLKIIFLIYGIFVAINVTVLYIACHRSDWLPELLLYWDGLHNLQAKKSTAKYINKRVLIVTILTWAFVLSMTMYTIYLYIFKETPARFLPFTSDMPYFKVVKYAYVILDFFAYNAWLFPMVLTCGTCVFLCKEFSDVNNELLRLIGDWDRLAVRMPATRLRHQNVCKLVEKADKILCLHIAASFVDNILTICLTLYVLTSGSIHLDPSVLVVCINWAVMAIVHLGIGCVGGAMVNSQVPCNLLLLISFIYLSYWYIC